MTRQQLITLAGMVLVFSSTLNAQQPDGRDATNANVVVYGSTPGGFCAAIAAAREGASVILLEPTDHVGGVNTGGLSFSDSNQTVRSTMMGLFDEWHTRIEADYASRGIKLPYTVSVKDQAKWTYEPHVAARVTRQMLDEAGVTVLTKRWLKSVTMEGTRITALVTTNGTFTGKVFIDASYEGDLMAGAGVSWTIGREGRDEYGESLAGKQYPKRKMNISGFDAEGKLLPLITTTDAGLEEKGDRNVMVYSFRLCLTADPENRVPFPKPANYDAARFEVMRRYAKVGGRLGFDLYPLPGGKIDGNNSIGGQFSLGLVGGGNGWCEADEAGRSRIWEAHKQYTLEFYHFLTTDPAVPEATRKKFSRLGLCKDEFPDYDHFSPALYVREGRRMRGMYVLTQRDILEKPMKDDPIVVSSFPIDSHDCQRVALKGGGVINEGTIFPVRRKSPKQGYAYHVPYRSILPKPEECSNLLVPVALSCTHVGISSIRVEPTWMILGQSAGIAAALAVDEDVAVQELPYPKLRKRLLAQKQVLDLPRTTNSIDLTTLPGIVLDDSTAKLTGDWTRSTNFKPHIGSGYVYSGKEGDKTKGDGNSAATFRIKMPKSGKYQLLMAYSAHETRATNVPVIVTSGSHEKRFTVNQTRILPAGQFFRLVGHVQLEGGVETVITINNKDSDGFVIVDAMQLLAAKPGQGAEAFSETFDNFDPTRFRTKIPNKNTEVRDGALWTRGKSGGKYPPMVYLDVAGRDLEISFRYRHLQDGGMLWFFVDGDDGFGSVDHMLRVKLLRMGVQLQIDAHSLDPNHPDRQNNGRSADKVSGAYRLNQRFPLERVDYSANIWRKVKLTFQGDTVSISVDGKAWRKTLTHSCFDAAKRKLLWMQNGGEKGIEIDDILVHPSSLPKKPPLIKP